MERKILLCGTSSGRVYAYAESVLVLDQLQSDKPLGRLWSEHKKETLKERMAMSRHPMGDLVAHFQTAPESDCLVRRYRVITGGQPIMTITEYFPATYGRAS
jgi:chorismate-pyruvate lyase